MDLDGNGYIEAHEVKACFVKSKISDFKDKGVEIDDAYFEKIIKSIDLDGDGLVTFADFEVHMMKMVEDMDKGRQLTLL